MKVPIQSSTIVVTVLVVVNTRVRPVSLREQGVMSCRLLDPWSDGTL